MEQPLTAGLIDQVMPEPVGRASDRVTLCAVPAPLLVTVMSNPMGSPAETGPTGLATLLTDRFGQFTVMEAVTEPDPSFVVEKLAVLLTDPHVPLVVGDVM